ncbi:MAG TPA: alpha/beta hydrolase [Acidobacteriaceae bacterium]|jgi:pimeloyl-ACP methyl ester carboxylesterase|nr:alpha/beta hydrolase [Acidobacteriaceae bacterium]
MFLAATGVASLFAAVLAALLVQRRLRQARIASQLRLRGDRGIDEEHFLKIGGIDQWIGIRGEDANNPVLLVVHGGPGSSCSAFTPRIRSWEKHFTVVQWDQRGCGKTLARTGRSNSGQITMNRLIKDGIEVAEYLCARFRKERIFLLANSFGTTFGMDIARLRPDLLYAYIGADQNVGMVREREEKQREVISRLRSAGLIKGIKALERIGADPTRWTPDDFTAVARWTMKSDPQGFRCTMKFLRDSIWYAPGWKLKDIYTFISGMSFSLKQLLPEASRYDAWRQGTRFEVPIFIFQGEKDVLLTPQLARAYFDDLVAPVKRMTLISGSGHFAVFRRPELVLEELLTHVRPIAETA